MVDHAPLQVEIIPSVKYRQVLPKSRYMQVDLAGTCMCELHVSSDDIDKSLIKSSTKGNNY